MHMAMHMHMHVHVHVHMHMQASKLFLLLARSTGPGTTLRDGKHMRTHFTNAYVWRHALPLCESGLIFLLSDQPFSADTVSEQGMGGHRQAKPSRDRKSDLKLNSPAAR